MKKLQNASWNIQQANTSNNKNDCETNNCLKDNLELFIDLEESAEEKNLNFIVKNNSKCRWTKEEEKKLFNLTAKKSLKDWDYIASNFKEKTKEQCYTKYSKLITNFKKGKWTEAEDNLIIELSNKFNFDWKLVASDYKERSLTQIKQRYFNCLDPHINREKFSDEEDKLLMEKVKIYGADWKQIAKFFTNRPSNLIKNRFYTKKRNLEKGIFIIFCFIFDFSFKSFFLFNFWNEQIGY